MFYANEHFDEAIELDNNSVVNDSGSENESESSYAETESLTTYDNDSTICTSDYPARCLAICEFYHKDMHGFTQNSDPSVIGHFMVVDKLDPYDLNEWKHITRLHQWKYQHYSVVRLYGNSSGLPYHPIVRNYSRIISRRKYLQPEIVECIYLRGDECVAIIKTFWLRLIQRCWKRAFSQRKQMQRLRFHLYSINYRIVCGRWPDSCNHLPTIHGILKQLY